MYLYGIKKDKIMDKIYCDLMLFASGVIAVLAVMILGMKIPQKPEFSKFRKSRTTLAASFITLSALNFVCYFTGYDSALDKLNTLIVASYQALLLTGTLLVFIRPDVVTKKWVWSQTAAITAMSALLYAAMFLAPALYRPLFCGAAVLLILQLIIYSIRFFRSLSDTLSEANDYYAEECAPRLSRIKAGFILMLAIGVMALCTLFTGPWFYTVFVPTYLICYTFVAMCMQRYIGEASFILPAIADTASEAVSPTRPDVSQTTAAGVSRGASIPEEKLNALRERLRKWEAEGKHREKDIPYKDILKTLYTDAATMRTFMKSENGMDFRSWRNQLRLRDACTMLREHPEMTAGQVSEAVGYSDGSNFHTDFRKFTGMSSSEYRRAHTDSTGFSKESDGI